MEIDENNNNNNNIMSKLADICIAKSEINEDEKKFKKDFDKIFTQKLSPSTNDKTTHVYTDGSLKVIKKGNKNIYIGGVGVYFRNNDIRNISEPFLIYPFTNNRAEILSIIKAIENFVKFTEFEEGHKLIIHSDSMYTINSITNWITNWKKKGWKTANGKPVKNRDLFTWLDGLLSYYDKKIKITFEHVKAHKNEKDINPDKNSSEYKEWFGNKMADKFATNGSEISRKMCLTD